MLKSLFAVLVYLLLSVGFIVEIVYERLCRWLFYAKFKPLHVRGTQPKSIHTVAIIINQQFIINQDLIQKLLKLIEQLSSLGIQNIYLYDKIGILKKSIGIFEDQVKQTNLIFNSQKYHNQLCQENNIQKGDSQKNNQMNGQTKINGKSHNSLETQIFVLNQEDTQKTLNGMLINQQQIQLESLCGNTEKITKKLKQLISSAAGGKLAEEADVILVFGDDFQLGGFPPWLTRLSEIFYMGKLQRLSNENVMGVMAQYFMKHQRFGK
eukprot:TRINITY_DN13755_c0_g2_i1.p2 TRINITY_DN13755_c0_g2~~TRINITY_DN13755_c0_g2_i1.p2  ORF type:complete len:295 (-),score=18.56 TRINITY_DN13755_c0_g2_i1:494-1291(-)